LYKVLIIEQLRRGFVLMEIRNERKLALKIFIGFIIFMIGVFYKSDGIIGTLHVFFIAYLIIGVEVLLRAVKNILRGEVFDENFLMVVATAGAFIIGDFAEGVAIMLFYQVGELFQRLAEVRSSKAIAELMDIRPDYAKVQRGDQMSKVRSEDVNVGEIIVIQAGEKVPLDTVIIEGESNVDTSAITGESRLKRVYTGDVLLSGCINMNGLLKARVTKVFNESTVSKILDLVKDASAKKSSSEKFITRFAHYYTPCVVTIALFIAIAPVFILNLGSFEDWLYRALIFLVVSCPCALVMSIPLSFFAGLGGASKQGILIKGGNYLEALTNTDTVVFDKTGTMTQGVFKVQEVVTNGIIDKNELLKLVAYSEAHSNHPIALSLKDAYGEPIDGSIIRDVKETAGFGVTAYIEGRFIAVGNSYLMKSLGISFSELDDVMGTVIHVALDYAYSGHIIIADNVKEDAFKTIRQLKDEGVSQTVMLTGDSRRVGERVATYLGIDKVYTELLPVDKMYKVDELIKEKRKLIFVGDGINDAPVLTRADIGVAMGGLGTDAAIEAADIVIMTDEPSKLVVAIKIAKKTLCIVKQNIAISLLIKAFVIILGATGMVSIWAAIFADVGVSIIVILNAMRMLNSETYSV
jgi:Cd2+/Zn2+-exporting ATPase